MNFVLSLIIFVFLCPLPLQAEEDQTLPSGSSATKPEVIPKALPVKSSNENANENRKALRALPLVPLDPEAEEKPLSALPVDKEKKREKRIKLRLMMINRIRKLLPRNLNFRRFSLSMIWIRLIATRKNLISKLHGKLRQKHGPSL